MFANVFFTMEYQRIITIYAANEGKVNFKSKENGFIILFNEGRETHFRLGCFVTIQMPFYK